MLTLQLSAKHMYILYVLYQDFYNILDDMYMNCDMVPSERLFWDTICLDLFYWSLIKIQ